MDINSDSVINDDLVIAKLREKPLVAVNNVHTETLSSSTNVYYVIGVKKPIQECEMGLAEIYEELNMPFPEYAYLTWIDDTIGFDIYDGEIAFPCRKLAFEDGDGQTVHDSCLEHLLNSLSLLKIQIPDNAEIIQVTHTVKYEVKD